MHVCMYLFENLRYFLNNILIQKIIINIEYILCVSWPFGKCFVFCLSIFIKGATNKCIINIKLRLIQKIVEIVIQLLL